MTTEERDQLLLFWSGELEDAANQTVCELIDRDEEARRYLEELGGVESLIQTLPDPPARGIAARALNAEAASKVVPFRVPIARVIGIAAAVALLVGITVLLSIQPVRESIAELFHASPETENKPLIVPEEEQIVEAPPQLKELPKEQPEPVPESGKSMDLRPSERVAVESPPIRKPIEPVPDVSPLEPMPLIKPLTPETKPEKPVIIAKTTRRTGFEAFETEAAEEESEFDQRLREAWDRAKRIREQLTE
ncbi:MAG: hypothetical protein AAGH89_09525 [Verrucomicrobiota bacterium]